MPWDADAQAAFGELGWAPEGKVFYSYASYTSASPATGGHELRRLPALLHGRRLRRRRRQRRRRRLILYVHPDDVGGVEPGATSGS